MVRTTSNTIIFQLYLTFCDLSNESRAITHIERLKYISMKRLTRSILSSPKHKIYTDSGVELDLTYITKEIIVCSGPEIGNPWTRYPLSELKYYLETTHSDSWKFWNFRDDFVGYDSSDVDNNVNYIPFPDHHPPSLSLLADIVFQIDEYLNKNDGQTLNIAVLHCKAGKGRSGMMCCAYLMYSNGLSATKAMRLYTSKRMQEFAGEGVSILSQIRYLHYWERILSEGEPDCSYMATNQRYRIKKILVTGATKFSKRSGFQLNQYKSRDRGVEIESVYKGALSEFKSIEPGVLVLLPVDMFVKEDVQIVLFGCNYLWFNCSLDSGKFQWKDFDGWKGLGWRGIPVIDKIEVHTEKVVE